MLDILAGSLFAGSNTVALPSILHEVIAFLSLSPRALPYPAKIIRDGEGGVRKPRRSCLSVLFILPPLSSNFCTRAVQYCIRSHHYWKRNSRRQFSPFGPHPHLCMPILVAIYMSLCVTHVLMGSVTRCSKKNEKIKDDDGCVNLGGIVMSGHAGRRGVTRPWAG